MKITLPIVLLYILAPSLFSQAPIYHADSVVLEEGSLSSVLEYKGFEEFEILQHSGEFVEITGSVIRPQTGYTHLLPYAYGIISVDLNEVPPTITSNFHTQNFTAEIIDDGSSYHYRLVFDALIDVSQFSYLITPLDSDDATQAAAVPLSGADKNKLDVYIFDQDGDPSPGFHSFSILFYYP